MRDTIKIMEHINFTIMYPVMRTERWGDGDMVNYWFRPLKRWGGEQLRCPESRVGCAE
jgi:hypothetical protein